MPSIVVQIEWDVPDDPNWLNPYNLELVLEDFCRNTAFTVTQVNAVDRFNEQWERVNNSIKRAREKWGRKT